MLATTFRLSDLRKSFATRSKAGDVFRSFNELVASTETHDVVVDWTGVSAASPSFIDEFVGHCCDAIESRSPCITIKFCVDEKYIVSVISSSLNRRGCHIAIFSELTTAIA